MQDPPTPPKPSGRLIGKPKPVVDLQATQDFVRLEFAQTPLGAVEDEEGEEVTQKLSRTDADNTLTWLRDMRKPQMYKLPERLGQYDVLGKIAQGGMGWVLRG